MHGHGQGCCARSDTTTAPAAGRWWWRTASPTSDICAARTGRPSSTCAIPGTAASLRRIGMPPGTHSHKVRVGNGLMVVNHEVNGADKSPVPADFRGGVGIYDVADPAKPRQVARWDTAGKGVHRYDFDGRYAYLSATMEGYVGTIVLIMDLEGAGAAAGGRTLVDAGAMDGGRRAADVGARHAPLPPSAAARQPALHQLLDGGVRDPGRRGHEQAQAGVGARLVAAVLLPDAHGAAAALRDPRPALPRGRRRGRTARGRPGAGVHVDGRRDGRAPPGARSAASRWRASSRVRSRP